MRTPRRQQGQSLLVLVVLLGALIGALWWTTEAGSAVNEKQRLANAADAAALSAAVWQARALNFDAYTNRAIVANEAALAQSVSLRSWSSYMTRLLPGAALVTAWVPYLNSAMMTLQRLWHHVDAALQPSLMALEATTSLVSHDIAAAQRVMHLGTATVVPAILRESLAETDPRFRLSTGGEAAAAVWATEWLRFASFYGGSFRWRQRDVVHRSLDGFSSDRRYTLSPVLGTSLVRFEKRGGTELVDFDNWRGLDTMSLHARRGVLFGSIRERTPIAWGASESGQPSFSRGEHGDSYRRNPRASRLADRAVRRSAGYLGLPSLYDLSAAQRDSFSPPRILVRVTLDDSSRRGAKALLGFTSVPTLTGREQRLEASAPRWFAESAATTPFERPHPRLDGARELPSLFSPFWRASLVSLTSDERIRLATLDGSPIWLAAAP